MAGVLDDHDQPWWAAADVGDEIQETLNHVNRSRERSRRSMARSRWELDACEDLFKALNRLWTTRGQHLDDQHLAGDPAAKQLAKLLRELGESDRSTLLSTQSVELLAVFEPAIFDHRIVGRRQRIVDMTEGTRQQAEADHRHFKEDWSRWRQRGSGVSDTLASLSRAILVVRNNIAHGEKTLVGPDRDRAERNHQVGSVMLGVLEELIDFLLGHPSRKLAVYGTLRRGEPNYEILKDICGAWAPVRMTGIMLSDFDVPAFSFSTNGSAVTAELLSSTDLAKHWSQVDEFEGSGYSRHLGLVWRDEVPEIANVYVVSPP